MRRDAEVGWDRSCSNAWLQGYGKALIEYAFSYYANCKTMLVGIGDVPSTLGFYHKGGFSDSHRVKNSFTEHYDSIMIEDGIQLVDMVYLKHER